ncbi:hypothetical protein D3C87_765110 [compost metagenome]
MIGRHHSGLIASLLALSLMACTGGPLAIKTGPDGRPVGTDATPKIPSPSPFVELETPGQPDEPVLDPIPNLTSNIREIDSPRDQQIQRIFSAMNGAGTYKFFLQQGEHFYHRTASQAWSDTQRLPSHRAYSPTRLFSDGEWLFFVNDPNESQFSGEERIYQAKAGSGVWSPSTVPKGIVAVASGPGFAFAATERHLYAWDGQLEKWSDVPIVDFTPSLGGERFIGLTVDTDSPNKDLIALMSGPNTKPYPVMRLPEGSINTASLKSINVTFKLAGGDRPLRVYRSYLNPDPMVNTYRYWGFSTTGRVYFGDDNSSMGVYEIQSASPVDFTKPFKGFMKQMGHFYAYRNDATLGPQVFYLKDENVSSRWRSVNSIKTDDSPLMVTLSGENSLATDGLNLYAAGPEGLFSHPTLDGEPTTFAPGRGGWAQESVALNRAQVNQVIRCGTTLYAKTQFGTYAQKNGVGAWLPFVLNGRPATIFTSIYGHVATVGNATYLDEFYHYQNGTSNDGWQKVTGAFSAGVRPKAGKVFFTRDRLFVAAEVPNGEAIYQRDLKAENLDKPWILAAKDQGLSTTYPTYISDGRVVFAVGVGASKVRLSSLTDQLWKDYPPIFVLPNGSTEQKREENVVFGVPFAVYGYAFVWVNMGGGEYRLCRATAKGWKPLVSDNYNGTKVGQVLSTDGHYLYSSTESGGNTREIVRVPIKDGAAWEPVPLTFNGASLVQANLKVNAPPFIDRDSAQIYLPTSRGILGP